MLVPVSFRSLCCQCCGCDVGTCVIPVIPEACVSVPVLHQMVDCVDADA